MSFCLHISGERALFMRLELRNDRVSYDLITPHAARGIFDFIYRRHGMSWVIDTIAVLNPVQHELLSVEGRRVVALSDVAYLVEAHFDLAEDQSADAADRHAAVFSRKIATPVEVNLGSLGYPGIARRGDPLTDIPQAPIDCDYGWLLHSPDFSNDGRPRYFRARAVEGRIAVPPPKSPCLFR